MEKKPKPTTIDEYLIDFPEEVQAILQQVRACIQETVPEATETISYAIPCFKSHGYLIYFAGWKSHISVYPKPKGMEKELAPYEGGKGTIKFPLNKPIPFDLIKKITLLRLQENLEREKEKKKK